MFELTFLLATFVTYLYRIMNRRLQQFLTAENISQSQFAESIGVARANVSHILSGRNKPGFDFIEKMLLAYPALNIDWLITGKGKMYRSSYQDTGRSALDNSIYNTNNQQIDKSYGVSDAPESDNSINSNAVGDLFYEPNDDKGNVFQSAMNFTDDDAQDRTPLQQTQFEGISGRMMINENSRRRDGQGSANHSTRRSINTLDNAINNINNQRVITKIIVYFSDNTFQELK